MGYTFAAALVKKTGVLGKTPTASATRKAIREGFEQLGYVKAANAEDASLVLPLHHDKKSAWLTIALEMPEDLDAQTELLRQLSAEMHTPILYFMNFDSDFLYVAATDGTKVQHVHVGFIDEDDEAMTDSADLSVFDALLPDEAARAEFRRILAVDDEERVFSESAAHEMAALFGYTPEALFVDEDAEPFAVLGFDMPGKEAVPFLMPEDAPPAFTEMMAPLSHSNPTSIGINSCGGTGQGVYITLQAVGYDSEEWEIPVIAIVRTRPEWTCRRCVPQRTIFPDGSKGWTAVFPDATIRRGANPAHGQYWGRKGIEYCFDQPSLFFALVGNEGIREDDSVYTCVTVAPLQHPEGAVSRVVPLCSYKRPEPLQPWMKDYFDEDT